MPAFGTLVGVNAHSTEISLEPGPQSDGALASEPEPDRSRSTPDGARLKARRSSPPSLRALKWFQLATAPLYWLYERRLERRLRAGALPKHIGIIMDGNRRFARLAGASVQAGHEFGASKAHEVLDWCLSFAIPHVTLWGFSSDNAGRDPAEVAHLHAIFAAQARELASDPRLVRHRVRVRVIGDVASFPPEVREALSSIERRTAEHDGMHLTLALGYGGREEIVRAVRGALLARAADGDDLEAAAASLDADAIQRHLWTAGLPDPDFVIRTSGEVRSSGFLLWQSAYAEYYFCDAYWPDFRRLDFLRALRSFQARERRFGR